MTGAPAAVRDTSPGRDDRIRILQFVNGFAMGGTERHVVNLGRMLDRSRFDLHFACLRRWGHFLEELEGSGAPIREYRIESLHNGGALLARLRFARDLRRERIEIVHTYNFYPNVFAVAAARLAGAPLVIASIRDTGVYLSPAQRWVQRASCRLAHLIVVNAEAVRSWLIEDGYRPERIVVIRNGVDTGRFPAPGVDGADLRRGLGIPPGARIVAVVSRLHEAKGLDDFLAAAAALAPARPDVRFLIVGGRLAVRDGEVIPDDAYRRTLERLAGTLGIADRVAFAGSRLDIPAILAQCAVSVLPSLSEGLSNSLLESMAAGLPVVATRVGGTPEAIEDGVSGLLVPPRDAASLARAIGMVLDDPQRAAALGRAARRRVEKEFSLEGMTRRTEDLYRSLLLERRPGRAGGPAIGLAGQGWR